MKLFIISCVLIGATYSVKPARVRQNVHVRHDISHHNGYRPVDCQLLGPECHGPNRTKRSALKVLEVVLSTARMLTRPGSYYRLVEKKGGREQAIADFRAFNPSKVMNYKRERWGIADDLTLRLFKEDDTVTLEVLKYKYKDGKAQRIGIDKIQYKD